MNVRRLDMRFRCSMQCSVDGTAFDNALYAPATDNRATEFISLSLDFKDGNVTVNTLHPICICALSVATANC